MWQRIRSPRPRRAAGGLECSEIEESIAGATTPSSGSGEEETTAGTVVEAEKPVVVAGGTGTYGTIMEESTIFEVVDRDSLQARMALPPRYRFRDLLLGDFAFNDDGER